MSDSVGLGGASGFACLTSSKVRLTLLILKQALPTGMGDRSDRFKVSQLVKPRDREKTQKRKIKLLFAILRELRRVNYIFTSLAT